MCRTLLNNLCFIDLFSAFRCDPARRVALGGRAPMNEFSPKFEINDEGLARPHESSGILADTDVSDVVSSFIMFYVSPVCF